MPRARRPGARASAPGLAIALPTTRPRTPSWSTPSRATPRARSRSTWLVARKYRYGKVSVCGYLADVYCLGVKNALGPEIMDDPDLRRFIRKYFSGYRGDPIEAPIELAREVVFGSVQYAQDLGFDPHPDFAAAAGISARGPA